MPIRWVCDFELSDAPGSNIPKQDGNGLTNVTRIYLDYNASTPVDPVVAAAADSFVRSSFGNPSSEHWAGIEAKAALECARTQVATLLNCAVDEVIFTSGGSESNNLALKGVFFSSGRIRPHFITTQIEHPAILAPCRFLERMGAAVTYLPVDGSGRVDPGDVLRAITPHTLLVSIMHANNEVGTIQPIEEISQVTRDHGIKLHTDAAQSVGKIATNVELLGVDLLTVAGHKLYAPKGVGALFVRRGVQLEPLIHGAGHEGGRRAGTESAMLAVALGSACRLASDLTSMRNVHALKERLWQGLRQRLGDRVVLNGDAEHCLPNTLSVSFKGQSGLALLGRLPDVAASTGSACHAGRIEPSPVLRAMRVPSEVAIGAIRFSLGRSTTAAEIDEVIWRIAGVAGADK